MKTKLLVAFAFLSYFIFLAYWILIMPHNIRKECEYEVFRQPKAEYSSSREDSNLNYRRCLVKHGMAPESIYVGVE